ncbi:P-loop containing nucleoside triphosphate hydrolase protein [Agrocybe pediades]|nr:P-loop containing nucleoside triphosphate hydrolase protein [Agrocybe pediades]
MAMDATASSMPSRVECSNLPTTNNSHAPQSSVPAAEVPKVKLSAGNAQESYLETRKSSFAALGLDSKFVKALQTAFPKVVEPTGVQERLIPEVWGDKDILLKDITGSGKSFGLILGLLNKPRKVLHVAGGKKRVVTTLFMVPHRDLAFQLLHWIERLTSVMRPSPPLPSIVQVLVRGSDAAGASRAERIAELKKTPPHILICTPQALKEVYEEDKTALKLDTLSTVVVDEVDYLVDIDDKNRRKIKHPGPTREMLDVIYARRKELCENQYDPSEDEEGQYESAAEWRNGKEREEEIPQLILSSATLKVHFKNFLFTESGWLNSYNLVKISGDKKSGAGRIMHSILVTTENGVKNIEGAVQIAREEEEIRGMEAEEEEAEEDEAGNEYFNAKYRKTPSPFDPSGMEAIATAFALDVPSIALLVIPSSAPVHRAVHELRELGVNAESLDLLVGKKGQAYLMSGDVEKIRANPRLLVATVATTRGVDLPELSHVFMLGMGDGGRDGYVHVAGRVGRFGRAGKVISVVSDQNEAVRMNRLLATIGEQPVLFQHFD